MKQLYSTLVQEYKKLRIAEQKFGDQKKVVESLKADMLLEMENIGTSTYSGNQGTISLAQYEVPVVSDWDQLYKYIHKNSAFDLLQRRITNTAWRDRIDDGEKIKGVEPMTQTRLRITVK